MNPNRYFFKTLLLGALAVAWTATPVEAQRHASAEDLRAAFYVEAMLNASLNESLGQIPPPEIPGSGGCDVYSCIDQCSYYYLHVVIPGCARAYALGYDLPSCHPNSITAERGICETDCWYYCSPANGPGGPLALESGDRSLWVSQVLTAAASALEIGPSWETAPVAVKRMLERQSVRFTGVPISLKYVDMTKGEVVALLKWMAAHYAPSSSAPALFEPCVDRLILDAQSGASAYLWMPIDLLLQQCAAGGLLAQASEGVGNWTCDANSDDCQDGICWCGHALARERLACARQEAASGVIDHQCWDDAAESGQACLEQACASPDCSLWGTLGNWGLLPPQCN